MAALTSWGRRIQGTPPTLHCGAWNMQSEMHPRICLTLQVTQQIDLFASAKHHQLPRYFTVDPEDPNAMGVNAFNFVWDPCILYYANPLGALLNASYARR